MVLKYYIFGYNHVLHFNPDLYDMPTFTWTTPTLNSKPTVTLNLTLNNCTLQLYFTNCTLLNNCTIAYIFDNTCYLVYYFQLSQAC